MNTRAVLVAVVGAAVAVAAGVAHAGPAKKPPLVISDPQGDSRSSSAGHDLTRLTLSSGKNSRGLPILSVRMDVAGPAVLSNTLYEVTFRTPTCAVRLAKGDKQSLPPYANALTFDCGPEGAVHFGFENAPVGDVKVAGSSITWTVDRLEGLVEPGTLLRDIKAYSAVTDPLQALWSANTLGTHSYDVLSTTATYKHH